MIVSVVSVQAQLLPIASYLIYFALIQKEEVADPYLYLNPPLPVRQSQQDILFSIERDNLTLEQLRLTYR